MATLHPKVPSWQRTTSKTEHDGVTTSLGGLSSRNAVSCYLSRNRGSSLSQRAGVEPPRGRPTVRCTQSQVDSAAAPASLDPAVTTGQAPGDPLLLVAPESLSYPSGFLGARQEENVGASGPQSSEIAPDSINLDGYLRMILTSRVYDVAVETALEFAPKLSDRTGNRVFLKREDTQPVFSFKLRGAYNMMANLSASQLARGVICSSAGNHAQGVAMSASRLGCSAVVAMPVTTPEIKWRAVQRLGAEVVLVGDSYDDTQAYAIKRAAEEGRVFVPPFDHPLVIAGQGTVGMEIVRQWGAATTAADAHRSHSSSGGASGNGSSSGARGIAENGSSSSSGGGSSTGGNGIASANGSSACVVGDVYKQINSSDSSSSSGNTADGASSHINGIAADSLTDALTSRPPAPMPLGLASEQGGDAAGNWPHAVFVPVGGGGLIAGIAAYIKALCPQVRVIGVEPADANALALSLQKGRRVRLSACGTFADGVAVRVVGEETFRLCHSEGLVDGVVLVSRDEICAAIKDVFEETRSILEPAGALSLAGAKAYCQYYGLRDANVIAVTSGANMNFDRLRLVTELADVGARREAVLATTLPEEPGAFKRFAQLVGASMNITEFKYRFTDPRSAHVLFSVGVHKGEELQTMIDRLEAGGFSTMDLTDNDVAKDHLRHLVGGRAAVPCESLFRVVFPERPGALMKFLDAVSPRWNITLFHYRRQGEMGANILVGLQIRPSDTQEFEAAVSRLGYDFSNESNNKALAMFMQ